MKKITIVLLILMLICSSLSCSKDNLNNGGGNVNPEEHFTPTPDTVPEITNTVDTTRLRAHKITDSWTLHDGFILQNFVNLYNCEVVKVDDEEYPYRVFIFGENTYDDDNPHKGYDSIYHGRGRNLETWEMWCGNGKWDTTMNPSLWTPVMTHGDTNYDSVHNGDPSVVYKNGTYYMAFSSVGFDFRDDTFYIINCIMGATSKDGINWTKSKSPIMIWDREYIESWDAHVPNPPSTGGYHRPSIIWDYEENKWKLWFDYYLPGTFLSMGYAVCGGDFLNPDDWTLIHAEQTPQLRDWPNPEVVKINGKYYAFSDAPGFGTSLGGAQNDRRLLMAYSADGYNWRVIGQLLPESKEYGTHLPQTYVETDSDGTEWLYLFYSCTDEPNLPRYIGANYMRIRTSDLEELCRE